MVASTSKLFFSLWPSRSISVKESDLKTFAIPYIVKRTTMKYYEGWISAVWIKGLSVDQRAFPNSNRLVEN